MAEQVEILFDLEPSERLAKEIETLHAKDIAGRRIGEFLLEQFKKDQPLADAYRDRKVMLNDVLRYVNSMAEDLARTMHEGIFEGCHDICIDDATVYGWVIHFVQDGDLPENRPTMEKIVSLTEEEKEDAKAAAIKRYEEEKYNELVEAEKAKKEAEAKRLARLAEKEKKEREKYGQFSLFDFDQED